MMGESRQFWEVGPKLAERGFRAVAVDLPGHGLSAPCTSGGLEAFAVAVTDSVPAEPSLAVGHSLGAMVLAQALPILRPERAVYVDVPFEPVGVEPEPLSASALTVNGQVVVPGGGQLKVPTPR
jgi:pimeloyl-ACP methyl ester carboxylesterase